MQNLESEIANALVCLYKKETNIVKKKSKVNGFTANDLAKKLGYYRKNTTAPDTSRARALLTEMQKRNYVKMTEIIKSDKGKGRTTEIWQLV